jgi:uncharacterized protein DUF5658
MPAPIANERRARTDRRRSVLQALWHGNFKRRRIAPRRTLERHAVVTDWFHAQWLGVAILILLLCTADAVLTLLLISHGAVELNPLMDPLVRGSGHGFALLKLGLTAGGVVLLTLLGRLRIFGQTVGYVLYLVLVGYVVLVGYELFLLRNIPID